MLINGYDTRSTCYKFLESGGVGVMFLMRATEKPVTQTQVSQRTRKCVLYANSGRKGFFDGKMSVKLDVSDEFIEDVIC